MQAVARLSLLGDVAVARFASCGCHAFPRRVALGAFKGKVGVAGEASNGCAIPKRREFTGAKGGVAGQVNAQTDTTNQEQCHEQAEW